MPVNKPVIPVQPKEQRYSIEKLYLTPRLTRESYLQMFGEEASFYNPARRPKRWFLTDILDGSEDPANELVQYQVWDPVKKAIVSIVMTKLEAATPNIPGEVKFQEYVNSEITVAQMVGPTVEGAEGVIPLNGKTLADPTLAEYIAKEIEKDTGVKYKVQLNPDPWPWKIVYGSETRRSLSLVRGNEIYSAAMLLEQRFRNGLKYPGKWKIDSVAGPVFYPDTIYTGLDDTRPEVPVPVRPLYPNERIETTPFGSTVVRIDLSQNEPAPGTGSLTAAQDKMLKQISEDVAFIKAKLMSFSG